MTAQTGPDVVAVGAGVIGLSTAVCLAERGRRVEVRTEREPAQTTSAVASAMIGPAMAPPDSEAGRWEQASVAQFSSLAEQQGTGVMMRRGRLAARERVPPPPGDFAECGADELPPGFAVGYWAKLPLVEMVPTSGTLPGGWRRQAVGLSCAKVDSLLDVAAEVPLIVNCAGLGGTQSSAETPTEPQPEVAERILSRCIEVEPRLRHARVRGHQVGLRPARPAVRLEIEQIGAARCVHNYGHGGSGVTLSWGSAFRAAALLLSE